MVRILLRLSEGHIHKLIEQLQSQHLTPKDMNMGNVTTCVLPTWKCSWFFRDPGFVSV
ncbi:UNVERIFIED_CONTAM: hypothetical protein FKN15_055634 [Acipenser sinensis]